MCETNEFNIKLLAFYSVSVSLTLYRFLYFLKRNLLYGLWNYRLIEWVFNTAGYFLNINKFTHYGSWFPIKLLLIFYRCKCKKKQYLMFANKEEFEFIRTGIFCLL